MGVGRRRGGEEEGWWVVQWTHGGQFLNRTEDSPAGGDTSDFIRNGEWELIGKGG